MREYKVRPAEHGDAVAIALIAKQSWNHTYGSIYPKEVIRKFVSEAYSIERLHGSISRDSERPVRLFHVALDSERNLAGYSQTLPCPDRKGAYDLARIYALPGTIGTGVGAALLNHLLLKCTDITELSAWVEERNTQGRRFYEKHGFKVSGGKETELFGFRTRELRYSLIRHS